MIVIVWLEFELVYYNVAVQQVSLYAIGSSFQLIGTVQYGVLMTVFLKLS